MQSNFSPRNISSNKVERVVPNALEDFRCGESVLRASRSTFDCIVPYRSSAHPVRIYPDRKRGGVTTREL